MVCVGLDDSAFSKFYIYTSMIKAASKNIDYITVAYEVRGNLQTTWSPPPPISHRNNNAQFLSSLLCMCKSRQKMLQYFTKEKICSSIANSIILSLSPNLRLIFSTYLLQKKIYIHESLSLSVQKGHNEKCHAKNLFPPKHYPNNDAFIYSKPNSSRYCTIDLNFFRKLY